MQLSLLPRAAMTAVWWHWLIVFFVFAAGCAWFILQMRISFYSFPPSVLSPHTPRSHRNIPKKVGLPQPPHFPPTSPPPTVVNQHAPALVFAHDSHSNVIIHSTMLTHLAFHLFLQPLMSSLGELSRAAFNAQHLPAVNPSSHRDDWDSNFSRPFNYLTDKQLVSFFKSNPDLSVSLDDARLVRFAFEHQRLVRGLVLPLLFDQRATMIFARLHSYSDIHIDPALDRLIHVIDDAPWASYLIRLVIAPSHSIYEAVSEISSASSFDEWIQFVFMFLSFLEGLQCCAFIYDFVVFRKVRSFESLKFFMQLRDGAIHQFISRPLIVAVSSLASYYILWPLVPAPWLLLASNALLFNLPAWYLFQTYSSLMRSVHALRILKEGYAETQKQELIDILKSKQIQIHRVSFKKRLGQGGFGQVYAASIFGTDVAVKFMNRQIDLPLTKMEVLVCISNQSNCKQFFVSHNLLPQISILRQLNHPNIVGILGTIGGAGNGSSASSLVLGDTCFFPGLVLGEFMAECLNLAFGMV